MWTSHILDEKGKKISIKVLIYFEKGGEVERSTA